MKKNPKYLLTVYDESHLSRVGSIPLRWWVIVPAVILFFAVVVATAVALIMNTPLRQTLPGYLPPTERKATIDDLIEVDSLHRRVEMNESYMQNLLTVLDTDRQGGDSVMYAAMSVKQASDSLVGTSSAEKEFRAMMDERERYNLSILAPMAAEGMIFAEPAPGYTFAKGVERSTSARIVVPGGESIRTIADGCVIDVHFTPSAGYVVVIQHSNGFISKWSHLGLPHVSAGESISAGQTIGPTPAGMGLDGSYSTLRMWRNGVALIPYNILRYERKETQSVEPLSQLKK